MTMSVPVSLHLLAALPALAIGAFMLSRPKGTPLHKMLGKLWIGLIASVAVSSFWIQDLRSGAGYSFIHLLSIGTLFAVIMAFVAIRRGHVRRHRG